MDLFIAVTRDRDDMNQYDWRKFAEEIKKDLGKKESSALYLAGLPLVEKGIFTIAHIRKIARRFHGDAKASFEAESDIEAITACFGRLGDIPKNLETMNDLPSGCRDFGSVNTTNHYRIAAGLLKVAMTCSRDTLAEVIHALSRWQSLRSKQTAAAARESYFAAIGMEAEANTWKRNPVSFQIFRQVRVLNGILVQPGYSQPFDLLGFAVREMIRRIRRW